MSAGKHRRLLAGSCLSADKSHSHWGRTKEITGRRNSGNVSNLVFLVLFQRLLSLLSVDRLPFLDGIDDLGCAGEDVRGNAWSTNARVRLFAPLFRSQLEVEGMKAAGGLTNYWGFSKTVLGRGNDSEIPLRCMNSIINSLFELQILPPERPTEQSLGGTSYLSHPRCTIEIPCSEVDVQTAQPRTLTF